ncbi:MAG: efflux RND transporter periplasmic adaptor subunit [Proteobacteria bacterium]|nr:efflux RND transporter periplasmic adaptor subunit [Pseudomonadota bacterium]
MTDLSKLSIDRDAKRSAAPARRGRGRMKWMALAAALLGALLWYRSGGFKSVAEVEVGTVTAAYPSAAVTLFNATGYVVPQTRADVASKATGRLQTLEVVEGSVVKKDQVLARLESADVEASRHRAEADVIAADAAIAETRARRSEAEARVLESKAELDDAERALRRARQLKDKRFVSDDVYDAALARRDRALAVKASTEAAVGASAAGIAAAEARLNASRAALDEARVAVEYTLIRAPFDGVVLKKEADVGDVLAPFAAANSSKGAVVTMADLDTLEVEADIAESNLTSVKAGQPCEIQLDALPDVRLLGEVGMVVPTVDRAKATLMAKVRFLERDPRVLPDMSARVAFLSQPLDARDQRARNAAPAKAITQRDGHEVVFRIDGKHVAMVTLGPGAALGELREVGEALKVGDKVVINPDATLRDGAEVRSGAAGD